MKGKLLNISQLLFAVLLILIGGSIYVLFRTDTLRLFHWIFSLGLSDDVNAMREMCSGVSLPDFVLYSLPDCLWLTSYLFIVNAVVPKTDKRTFVFWLCVLPVAAVIHECLQGLRVISGVFDISDLLCYLIPFSIFLFINLKKTTNEEIL